jgi:hypothetical protein
LPKNPLRFNAKNHLIMKTGNYGRFQVRIRRKNMFQTLKQLQSFGWRRAGIRGLLVALVLVNYVSVSAIPPCVAGAGRKQFDFNNDCVADVAVYKSTGDWWIKFSSPTNLPWGCGVTCSFNLGGAATDEIVPADYDGDGKTDAAVYHRSSGNWEIVYSSGSFISFQKLWGTPNGDEIPQPADYTNDGRADLAYFKPSTGQWEVYNLFTNTALPPVPWGTTGDKPVVGDYNGDDIADHAVFRNGVWYIRNSTTNTFVIQNFGVGTDIPVPADYNADGRTDIAVYRPGTSGSVWWKLSGGSLSMTPWGSSGLNDLPIPADYNGDNADDVAIYRPVTSSEWWVAPAGMPYDVWGLPGNEPIPHAFIQ